MYIFIHTLFLFIHWLASEIRQPENFQACNRAADSLVLVKFNQATDGPNWNTRWKFNLPMTDWPGVVLGPTGCVTELHLNSNNLNGTIPPEFGNLTGLKIVSIVANNLNGSLPLNIGNLTNLEDLSLEDNQLNGSIPTQITNLNGLKYLNLSKNSLSGSIPTTIGSMSNLLILNLSYNQLTNSIPSSISLLNKLKILDVSHNLLNGTVPASLGQLTTISEVYLNNNLLNGTLPLSLSNLTNLIHIWINDNDFTGMVPDIRGAPLNSFHIENNSFDAIPDYSNIVTWGNKYPFGLVIYGNKFTFEDLIPLTKIPSKYFYSFSPQDSIVLDPVIYVPIGSNYIIMTNVDPGLNENNFKWYKDTSVVYISNRNIYELIKVSDSDEGYYSGQVINPLIPNFELEIAKFRVVVYDPNKCDFPAASTNCKSAPEFCSSIGFHGYCGSLGFKDTTNQFFLCDSIEPSSNPKWLSFIAPTDSIVLEIFPRNCPGVSENGIVYTGIQAAIWNSCGGNNDSIVVCHSNCENQPFQIGGKYFQTGHRYNLVINGCYGDLCDFIIKVVAGKQSFQLAEPGSITGEQSFCPDSLEHLFSIEAIPGATLYQWFINDSLYKNSTVPRVNIQGFSPGFYQLKVRAINSCDTTHESFLLIRVTPELTLNNIVHNKVKIDSAYQISFTIGGGIKPYSVVTGRGTIDTSTNLFHSDTLVCKSAFDFEIADAQGCTISYSGYENCGCNSQAGAMPMDTIKVCEGQSFTVRFSGAEIQDPEDVGVYLLFTNSQDPKSTILKTSSNGLFPFDPSKYKFNVFYYVCRVVGRKDARGDINYNHPCISFSNFQVVVFRSRPLVSAGPDLTYCGFEGTLNSFGNYLSGLWKMVSGPAQAYIENPLADQTKVTVTAFGTYVFAREVSNLYCTYKDEVKIIFIESIKASIGGFYFVCDGQSTTLDGGDYAKYLWSTGDTSKTITVNTPGTYCITVSDAANCTGSTCIAVSNSTAPVPHLMAPDTLCTGDQSFIQLTQSYLKYNWNTKDSTSILLIDTGGLYCVTVTANNGCIGTDCITVQSKSRSYSNRYDTVCYGDKFTFLGQTYNEPGIHDFSFNGASQNGCDSVVRIHLTWRPRILLADSTINNDTGSGNGSINTVVTGGKAPYKYQWSTGAKTAGITNLNAGDYTLTVTDANNCHAVFQFKVKKVTSTNEVLKRNAKYRIYPNPLREKGTCNLHYLGDNPDFKLVMYNSNGKLVFDQNFHSNESGEIFNLDLNLDAGIYFVKIIETTGYSEIQKIILLN
jgi:hypothetical protein